MNDSGHRVAADHRLTLKVLLAILWYAMHRAEPGLIHPGDVVRRK